MKFSEHINKFTLKSSNKMDRLLRPLKEELNINYFNYYAISSTGNFCVVMSNPAFGEFYSSTHSFLVDPLLRHPQNYAEGVIPWSSLGEQCQSKLVDPIQLKFDMHHGLSLLKKSTSPDYAFEVIGFTGPKESQTILNNYLNNMDLFSKFFNYFKEEARTLVENLQSNPVNLKDLLGDTFLEAIPHPMKLPEDSRNRLESYFKGVQYQAQPGRPLAKLSKREVQCINLLLKGKSASATSEILGLSRRTVEYYLDNIKNKVNCDKKADLFEIFSGRI